MKRYKPHIIEVSDTPERESFFIFAAGKFFQGEIFERGQDFAYAVVFSCIANDKDEKEMRVLDGRIFLISRRA